MSKDRNPNEHVPMLLHQLRRYCLENSTSQHAQISKDFHTLGRQPFDWTAFIKRVDPPVLLCPAGGQAVWKRIPRVKRGNSSTKRIGQDWSLWYYYRERTTRAFHSRDGVSTCTDSTVFVRNSAIIYIAFVEPEYRQRDLGRWPQVIPLMHPYSCDFTVWWRTTNAVANW
jgi:hypothetical protein